MSKSLSIRLTSDKSLLYDNQPTERFVEITARAPESTDTSSRSPVQLALVLDRSGSMSGGKLAYAKLAAQYVVNQLAPDDRVAVVTFDDTVEVVSLSEQTTPRTKSHLNRLISNISVGGTTNLSGGWFKGCELLAESLLKSGINRVFLLTDGMANVGISDHEVLAEHARELRVRGIQTSTFGIGLGFNEDLLVRMAEAGGGRFHYIESQNDLPSIFSRELSDLFRVTVKNADLSIRIPDGTSLSLIGELENRVKGDKLRVNLGSMVSGEERPIYLRWKTTQKPSGETEKLRITLKGETPAGDSIAKKKQVSFTFASPDKVDSAAIDEELMRRLAKTDLAQQATQAIRLERSGKGSMAASRFLSSVDSYSGYLEDDLAHESTIFAKKLAWGMNESDRKLHSSVAYKRMKYGADDEDA